MTIWTGVPSLGIVSPYFFDDNSTLQDTKYVGTVYIPCTSKFHLDSARRCTLPATTSTIPQKFSVVRWANAYNLEKQSFQMATSLPRSIFFLWSQLKTKVYSGRPKNFEELKQRTRDEISTITPDVTKKFLLAVVYSSGLSGVVFHKENLNFLLCKSFQ